MTCLICRTGETAPGLATVTLERDRTLVVVKEAPADVCEQCGDYYLAADVARTIEGWAEDAVAKGAEVEILRYAA